MINSGSINAFGEKWQEQLSPEPEKCCKCKKVIAPFKNYFCKVFNLDGLGKPPKNVCWKCVAENDTILNLD